ncbi:CBN-SRW-90 protein [Caenorhabditis brenneri]|uniref:CBN-SRW-90 protein n=1 Tax=Caenorhabditis brenneri TaxID=135651 RepID=G0P0J5_CAEBE|nr:CBN-SRW-90 protein [Caenorhabditis brenneri]
MLIYMSTSFDEHGFVEIEDYTSQLFQQIVFYSVWYEFIFSKLGAFLNIFQIIILTRKAMRTSSTNVIMVGIAICDLVCMLIIVRNGYIMEKMLNGCTPPRTLFEMRLDWLLTAVHNALRRCSAWLGMMIALVRYLVITDITNKANKFSTPKYGLKAVLNCFLVSFFFTIIFYLHVDIVESGTWTANERCEGERRTFPVYIQQYNAVFESNSSFLSRARLFMEGIFAKLIPCFSLPVLTFLLLNQLRKTVRVSTTTTVEISMATKHLRKSRKERTTVITIFIAISFFLSEFPLGIVDLYKAMFRGSMNYEMFAQNVVLLCDSIFTINASTHCLVCFAMSFQYRKTVFGLLHCVCFFKKKKPSGVTTVLSSY